MNDILLFKTFCIENYKVAHSLSGYEAAALFMEFGVLDYLSEFYDVLHTQGVDYIIQDIDEFINIRRK